MSNNPLLREQAAAWHHGAMKTLVRWLVWIPLALVLALFFAANRHAVFISLDPFSTENPAVASPALPLWFWLCVFLLSGVGIGAAGLWLSGRDRRMRARADRDELRAARRQLAELQRSHLPRGQSPVSQSPGDASRSYLSVAQSNKHDVLSENR